MFYTYCSLQQKLKVAYLLSGSIGIGGTGSLQLSATMTGIWERAFGIKYLAFGNIAVSIGIIPGVAITEFGNSINKVYFI